MTSQQRFLIWRVNSLTEEIMLVTFGMELGTLDPEKKFLPKYPPTYLSGCEIFLKMIKNLDYFVVGMVLRFYPHVKHIHT